MFTMFKELKDETANMEKKISSLSRLHFFHQGSRTSWGWGWGATRNPAYPSRPGELPGTWAGVGEEGAMLPASMGVVIRARRRIPQL